MRLSSVSCLRDGCGVLRLGNVGVKWGSRAQKGGGDFGGSCLRGGVDGEAVLCDEREGGFERGFGSAPFQVEGCIPRCFTRCDQYPSSSARYTQVVSNPYFSALGTIRRMFWARLFLLF